ncbi:MAG: hypothetical protein AAGJ11_17125 [Bacteroidota bacterium]
MLRSGRLSIPWDPDVPAKVVAARLVGQLRSSFGPRVIVDGTSVRYTVVGAAYGAGSPVVADVRLSATDKAITAAYEFRIERPGVALLAIGLVMGAGIWFAIGTPSGLPEVAVELIGALMLLLLLGQGPITSFVLVNEWIEQLEEALYDALPTS